MTASGPTVTVSASEVLEINEHAPEKPRGICGPNKGHTLFPLFTKDLRTFAKHSIASKRAGFKPRDVTNNEEQIHHSGIKCDNFFG